VQQNRLFIWVMVGYNEENKSFCTVFPLQISHLVNVFLVRNSLVYFEAVCSVWSFLQFSWGLPHHLHPKFMWQTKLSVFIGAPHLWPLHCGSDLCLARTPVSEVSLWSPSPHNHTRPVSSPYEGNKIRFKPDPDCFYAPHTQRKFCNVSLGTVHLKMCVSVYMWIKLSGKKNKKVSMVSVKTKESQSFIFS